MLEAAALWLLQLPAITLLDVKLKRSSRAPLRFGGADCACRPDPGTGGLSRADTETHLVGSMDGPASQSHLLPPPVVASMQARQRFLHSYLRKSHLSALQQSSVGLYNPLQVLTRTSFPEGHCSSRGLEVHLARSRPGLPNTAEVCPPPPRPSPSPAPWLALWSQLHRNVCDRMDLWLCIGQCSLC